MTTSERIYSLLLELFPRSFRNEYGVEMRQVFSASLAGAQRDRGVRGMVRLWAVTLEDLAVNATMERLEVIFMPGLRLTRLGGAAAVLGGGWLLLHVCQSAWEFSRNPRVDVMLVAGYDHTLRPVFAFSQFLVSTSAGLGATVCEILVIVSLIEILARRGSRVGAAALALAGVGLASEIAFGLVLQSMGHARPAWRVLLPIVDPLYTVPGFGVTVAGLVILRGRLLGPLSFAPLVAGLGMVLPRLVIAIYQPLVLNLVPSPVIVDLIGPIPTISALSWMLMGVALLHLAARTGPSEAANLGSDPRPSAANVRA